MAEWIADIIEQALDFTGVLNLSIKAGWLVLAVLLLRLLLKKAPKWIHVALWGIVALRLIIPFSFESVFSLVPSAETVSSQMMTYEGTQLHEHAYLDFVSNPAYADNISIELTQSVDRVQNAMMLMTLIWLPGIAAMLLYTVISYLRLRNKVSTAILLRDNVYQSENVGSPFVLGLVAPKIYIPFKVEDKSIDHVIAHEQAHIRRKDHLWKPLGFLLLTIHWFNPVMWLAYVLLCRDIELACDEKVVRELSDEQRADYSQALLNCSVNRWAIAACPLAFGEAGVKERVKSVLNYKKPAFWIIVVAIVLCVLVAVCFLTDPHTSKIMYGGRIYKQSGSPVEVLPEGSTEIGTLIGITHRTSDDPESDFRATNLDEKYAGCPLWQSGKELGTIYLMDYSGAYIPFVVVKEHGIVNPCVQEYIPGTGNILGSVDKEKYENISEDFAIGADKYGRAVFKNPYKAFDTFVVLYKDGIELIRDSFNLPAITSRRYEMYKTYGWQTTSGPEEAQAQAGFVSGFLDIYENSFDKDAPNASSYPATSQSAPTLSLNDVIILSQKGYDLSWEDFSEYDYVETGSGLYIRSYRINDLFSITIGGTTPDEDPWYIYLNVKDGTDERIDIRDGGVTEFIEQHHNNTPVESDISNTPAEQEVYDLIPMIKVDGVLYLDTGHNSFATERRDGFDGEITSSVDGSKTPTENDQSNFGAGYGYQYGAKEGTIELFLNGKWRIYATEDVRQEIQFPQDTEDELPDTEANSSLSTDATVWKDGISSDSLSPGETLKSDFVIDISDGTEIDLSITWARSGLTLTYGLVSENGQEYCFEEAGGFGKAHFEDIPAGSYYLFVKNSGDYYDLPAYQNPEKYNVSFEALFVMNYKLS